MVKIVTDKQKIKNKPVIVAELSINHLGMRKIAIAMLERSREIGVDYVKFKIKNVKKYYGNKSEKFNGYDFVNYRESLELNEEDFYYIDEWCNKYNLGWFATAHDIDGLKFLSKFNVPFYKIASSDSLDLDFVEKVLKYNNSKKTLIISTGGSTLKHIDNIVGLINKYKTKTFLMHCVSIYPTPVDKCNIRFISKLRERYESNLISIGYSGHETGWLPTLFAVQNGATMIERHITLTRKLNIHHINAALTINEFATMVDNIKKIIDMVKAKDIEYFDEELKFLKGREYK